MKLPNPGAPQQVDEETRIVAFTCSRLGRLYQVEVRLGPVNWQPHGSPCEDYGLALAQGHRVARRGRSERPDYAVHAEPDFQPDSHAYREARYPAVDSLGPDLTLGSRVRRARRRVGLRT